MAEIVLTVNGEREAVSVPAGETLLETLRGRLGLTGTKQGCSQGVCGSCTVLIDGVPGRSCLALSVACGDRAITTVEGLETAGAASPVQLAFAETGAVQCGFCSPGMILAAEALLRRVKAPSLAEVREAISGNLCRCSGYAKIVDAGLLASRRMAA